MISCCWSFRALPPRVCFAVRARDGRREVMRRISRLLFAAGRLLLFAGCCAVVVVREGGGGEWSVLLGR